MTRLCPKEPKNLDMRPRKYIFSIYRNNKILLQNLKEELGMKWIALLYIANTYTALKQM